MAVAGARPRGKAMAGLFAFVVLAGLTWCTGDDLNQWNDLPAILRCLPEFLVGVLIYRIYDRGLFAWLLATDLALGLVLTTVCALVHNAASDLAIALLFPGLILAAVRNEGHLGRLLNASLRWLGDVPYSLYLVLYLVHWFVLFALVQTVRRLPGLSLRQLPPRASLLAALSLIALSIALASVTYRVIEVPGRQWLRRRLTVGRPPPATDRAAPRNRRRSRRAGTWQPAPTDRRLTSARRQ